MTAATFIGFTGFTLVMPFLPLYLEQLGLTDVGEIALWEKTGGRSGPYRRSQVVFERGSGSYLYAQDGRRYLDCLSGAGTLALGHNHPVVLQAVINNVIRNHPQMGVAISRHAQLFDEADVIFVVMTADLSCLKNVRSVLETMDHLGYEKGKVQLVLNRSNAYTGINVDNAESALGRKIDYEVINEYRGAISALNSGAPFMFTKADSLLGRSFSPACCLPATWQTAVR